MTIKGSWFHKIQINRTQFQIKFRTAYKYTTSEVLCTNLLQCKIKTCKFCYFAYGGFRLNTKGILEMECVAENRETV